jgi:hypothetical protein
MIRYLFGFLCVCALGVMPMVGCDDDGGTGGTDLCVGVECDDFNDCTSDTCDSANGVCNDPTPVADGTTCAGGMCQAGVCDLTGTVLPCTEQGIRNAIAAGGGPYTFECDGPTTVVTEAAIAIDNDVILDGEGDLTVSGGGEDGPLDKEPYTIFYVREGVEAGLHRMTVSGRFCVVFGFDVNGPAIENSGTLTLASITLSENCAPFDSSGTLTLTNSTVSDNGDGISNNGGTLTIMNSTVSGNDNWGIRSDGTLTLTNSTISDNGKDDVVNGGTATVTNSLIDGDCGGDITSDGYNVESPGDTCGFDQTGDQPGVTVELLNLGELAANGGLTMTHKPGDGDFGDGSVAIDQIPAVDCVDAVGEPLTTDQRGLPRPAGTTDPKRCDVGAVEVQASD